MIKQADYIKTVILHTVWLQEPVVGHTICHLYQHEYNTVKLKVWNTQIDVLYIYNIVTI